MSVFETVFLNTKKEANIGTQQYLGIINVTDMLYKSTFQLNSLYRVLTCSEECQWYWQ